MAYRLGLDDPVPFGVRRIATEQLGSAIRRLEDAEPGDRIEAVHDARKSVKKVRALVRLVRSGLDPATYRAELTALRDAGRLLSGARDADVMLETLDALAERYVGRLPAATFTDLRDGVAAQLGERNGGDELPRALAALRAIAARVDEWPLDACDWTDVRAGATRSYARGRKRWKAARTSGDAAQPPSEGMPASGRRPAPTRGRGRLTAIRAAPGDIPTTRSGVSRLPRARARL